MKKINLIFVIALTLMASLAYAGITQRLNKSTAFGTSSISADGRYVALDSYSSPFRYVLIYDRQTNTTMNTKTGNGISPNGDCISPSISADGNFLAFYSVASNLVPGDTNARYDVFVYNKQTGMIEIASISTNGTLGNYGSNWITPQSISADGRYIVFSSFSNNLVTDDTNGVSDIFVRDMQDHTTQRISLATDGTEANNESYSPCISADGRYVAYKSLANNLLASDDNGKSDVFVYDMQTGETKLSSLSTDGIQGNRDMEANISISADGRYVAFDTYSNNLVNNDTNNGCDVFVRDMQANTMRCVSISNDGLPGNNNSYYPSISADGNHVAFYSDATNLVIADTNGSVHDWLVGRDVFVHNLTTGVTELVSVSSAGVQGNDHSENPSINADGRYISFCSDANNLTEGDDYVNNFTDVFVRDMKSEVISVSLDKSELTIKKYGQYGLGILVATINPINSETQGLIWSSNNTNVATVDSAGYVFAHNAGSCDITVTTVEGGKTAVCKVTVVVPVTTISLNKGDLLISKGASETLIPTISPSDATNKGVIWSSSNSSIASVDSNGLVTGMGSGNCDITATTVDGGKTAICNVNVTILVSEVVLNKSSLSLRTGLTETLIATVSPNDAVDKRLYWSSSNTAIATVASTGKVTARGIGTCIIKAKAEDGSLKAANCKVTVKTSDSFTQCVSLSSAGLQGNTQSDFVSISADGRYVAFTSDANNLVEDFTSLSMNVFVNDILTGKTTRVSVSSDGIPGNNSSGASGVLPPSISADGRYVAFTSYASNLVPNDTNNCRDAFFHDMQTGRTELVSLSTAGLKSNGECNDVAMSSNGRYIAFSTIANNLVIGDTNNKNDIFVRDIFNNITERISISSAGIQTNSNCYNPSISADGRYVVFDSTANTLVSGDTNGKSDIFVHDRQTGKTEIVSKGLNGLNANNSSGSPSISADGRYIGFYSSASNLVLGDTNAKIDIFVYDKQIGKTKRVSVSSTGEEANNSSGYVSISADGRFVVFDSAASNLVTADRNYSNDVFIHDMRTNKTLPVSIDNNGNIGGGHSGKFGRSISADGNYVAFNSESRYLVINDLNERGDIFVHENGFEFKNVTGLIDLQNYLGAILNIPVTITITDASNTVETFDITLDENGMYNVRSLLKGDCIVKVKASHWLTQKKSLTMAAGSNSLNFSLINGDCNGDNGVDEGDFGLMSYSWNTSGSDEMFNSNADLNGDGNVDEGDYGILSSAWYQSGE